MKKINKPILCLDFDGVLHSYISGWQGPRNIPDPPVERAIPFLTMAVDHFEVHVYSSRSHYWLGRKAMKNWIYRNLHDHWKIHRTLADDVFCQLKFPKHKPPATVSLDDRCLTFSGEFPPIEKLKEFKPWLKLHGKANES